MLRTLIVLLAVAGLAAAEGFAILPADSTVRFAGSSTLHDFAGTAKLVAGSLRLDGIASAGAVEADATSMETAHEGRDKKMHGETMQTATHPRVRFDLLAFEPTAEGGTARGIWTMHGVAREIAIPVTIDRGAQPPRARSTFVLDIREWDVRPPRVLVISVDPKITVTLDLALRADDTVAPPRLRRDLAGVAVVERGGAPFDVGAVRGRPVVLYNDDGAAEAKAWVDGLAAKLPAERAPLAVLDGRDLSAKAQRKYLDRGPAGALLDAAGALPAKAQLPRRPCVVLAVAPDGSLVGTAVGGIDDAARDRIVAQTSLAP